MCREMDGWEELGVSAKAVGSAACVERSGGSASRAGEMRGGMVARCGLAGYAGGMAGAQSTRSAPWPGMRACKGCCSGRVGQIRAEFVVRLVGQSNCRQIRVTDALKQGNSIGWLLRDPGRESLGRWEVTSHSFGGNEPPWRASEGRRPSWRWKDESDSSNCQSSIQRTGCGFP